MDIYIDINSPGGTPAVLDGLSSSRRAAAHTVMQGDAFALNLYFRTTAGVGAVATKARLATGAVVKFQAKTAPGGTVLFGVDTFTETETSSGSGEYYYTGTLAIPTTDLDSLFTGGKTSLAVSADVEVQNASNTLRTTYRIPLTLFRQVYANELPPVPPASELEIIGGVAYFEKIMLKSSTGEYHQLTCHTTAGVTSLRVEQVGEEKP